MLLALPLAAAAVTGPADPSPQHMMPPPGMGLRSWFRGVPGVRGLHLSTFQLNLSQFRHTSACPPV